MEKKLNRLKDILVKKIARKHFELFNEPPKFDNPVKVVISTKPDEKGVIAMYHFDSDIIYISPRATDRPKYLFCIMIHELIHAALGEMHKDELHGDKFHKMAEAMGLPEKYRD